MTVIEAQSCGEDALIKIGKDIARPNGAVVLGSFKTVASIYGLSNIVHLLIFCRGMRKGYKLIPVSNVVIPQGKFFFWQENYFFDMRFIEKKCKIKYT